MVPGRPCLFHLQNSGSNRPGCRGQWPEAHVIWYYLFKRASHAALWCPVLCPHVLTYKPSDTVYHLSFLLFWCPCSASHPVGRVWVLCSLGRKAAPTSSPGPGQWGPASPLPVWPAGGPEGDGGADALWGPQGTRELLFFLVRQAERHPKKSTSRSSSGQAVDSDPAAPGYLGLPG